MNPERISRRQFTMGSAGFVTIAAFGCGGSESSIEDGGEAKSLVKPPTEPFTVGPIERFRAPGVYSDFTETKRVWLVSDGSVLVALGDLCTHKGCGLKWLNHSERFNCPCHASKFSRDGTNLPGSKARRPLERWAIDLAATPDGPQVRIDPTRHFRQERDEWSDPAATLTLTLN